MNNVERLKLPLDKKLYAWQEKFINDYNIDRLLLTAEAGTGKTVAGICWLQLRPELKALVIAPKGIQLKWREELKEWGDTKADVVTTDAIKRIDLSTYQALVIDECQNLNSALFDKTRSARATVLYNFIRHHPHLHVFMASATPIRSKPENLHTLACYKGVYWDIKKFRDEFLHLTDRFGRFHYEPNKDWRVKIRPKLEQIAYIVNMSDCVDVPVHEHTIVNVRWLPQQENALKGQYLEPAKEWHTRHRMEQGGEKWKELEKILDGHAKVVVVCYYLEQIADYVRRIGDEREVFVLTGSTKDQGQVAKDANNSSDCVLIIQAGLGAGFDLDKFSVMVFASTSFAFVHLIQMTARINRIHNLHKNQYIYLLGGKCDKAVKEQLDKGFDFHPPAWYNKENGHTTGTATDEEKEGGACNPTRVSVDETALPF
jgi:hypothetical protein